MPIRIVLSASLAVLLVLVLYLPSAHAPSRFVITLAAEHERNRAWWGEPAAIRIASRLLWVREGVNPWPSGDGRGTSATAWPMPSAPASELAQLNARVIASDYVRAIDALFALATYRLCVLVEALPWIAVFILSALFDGLVRRKVKGKEFVQHNPETFALCASLAIVIACGMAVSLVLPLPIEPLLLTLAPVAAGICASLALGHYHARG